MLRLCSPTPHRTQRTRPHPTHLDPLPLLPTHLDPLLQVRDPEEERRPVSHPSLLRPTSAFALKLASDLGNNDPRFRGDNVLSFDLDMPERTTADYEVHLVSTGGEGRVGWDGMGWEWRTVSTGWGGGAEG